MNDLYSPDLVSLEYTPSLSASGSVARIISALTSLASLNAYVNALGSSGLGYSSVVKSGSGFSCSGTTYTFLKPNSLKILLTGTLPVPLNGEYTILISSATCLIISPLRLCFFNAAINASSISYPIMLYRPLTLASSSSIVLTSLKSVTALTSLIICVSLGAVIWHPSSQYTLYPLYSGGLWLAVTIIPAVQ